VIEDRKEVKFNPTKTEKPVAKTTTPAPKQGGVKPATKPAPKTAVKNTVANGGWYVQFGSYSSRALAESAQRKIQSQHQGLFAGKQFVILAAQLKNGTTTYRLRVAFANSNEANGFCRNAKADGLDCYVAR
jgi:cell division protein FtsN